MRKSTIFAVITIFLLPEFCFSSNLRYFRLYYSTTSKQYNIGDSMVAFGWKTTDLYWKAPSSGTWYFVVTAFYNTLESHYSREIHTTCSQGDVVHLAWDYPNTTQQGVGYLHKTLIDTNSTKTISRKPSAGGSVGLSGSNTYPGERDIVVLGDGDVLQFGEGDVFYGYIW